MSSSSIFMAQSQHKPNKFTYTGILETIPKNKQTHREGNWRKQKKTEWRWRFLTINGRKTAEISFMKWNSKDRIYFIPSSGKFEKRVIDVGYDKFVTKTFYCYSMDV